MEKKKEGFTCMMCGNEDAGLICSDQCLTDYYAQGRDKEAEKILKARKKK